MNLPLDTPSHRRLRTLSVNAGNRQWNADRDIDWSQNIIRPNWLMRRFHAALFSQFRHGELITARFCKHLLTCSTDPGVVALLTQQIADEERHAHVYERYLRRLGNDAPLDPLMAETVDRLFLWKGSHLGLMVAVHIILEGEALRTLQALSQEICCPLFTQINTHITRDEARHVAFGKVYLKQHLADLDAEERMEIFRFVRSLWKDCAAGILTDFKVTGIISQPLRRRWVAEGWALHSRALVDIGLLEARELARA